MFKRAGFAAAMLFLLTSAGFSQDDGRLDVSLGAAGLFPKQTTANGIVQKPTKSGAFLGTVRWRFSAKQSMEANVARGNDSQIYSTPFSFRIQSHVTEFSAAYVFRPIETKRFEPFLLAGAGVLIFSPFNTFIDTVQVPVPSVRQNEPAFLYGGGVDYEVFSQIPFIRRSALAPYLALRLQYRGLLYKAPNFKNPSLFTGSQEHTAEAAAGIVFKF